ncbi:unnamed protein product [Lactuca virosa]|uniref:Uncharacterized protein n=1 Tax=Lactuca virosa TaxID=75947 RepID=A0AAU9NWR5_9ASTR|nr:unnamed protein product [Lactuca virosa]
MSTLSKKEDIYNMLLKGILIQEGNVWFSIGSNGKRDELISARKFSYKNRLSHKWRSATKSRFHKVAEMLDISNLKIQIKIKPLFFVKHEEIKVENYDEGEKSFSENEVSKKKHYMLSAKEALYESSNVKLFDSIPSTQSRFQEVIELARQQVFHIKCKIESQRLSPDTEYACYLVFKLSENCHGLHCPVIVRDVLQRKNKEKGILYFRSPTPCNVNDTNRVPKEREDIWMEVNVWQFNSSNQLRDDCVSINLKLISYEGTMSGLIVSSLEFRSI